MKSVIPIIKTIKDANANAGAELYYIDVYPEPPLFEDGVSEKDIEAQLLEHEEKSLKANDKAMRIKEIMDKKKPIKKSKARKK